MFHDPQQLAPTQGRELDWDDAVSKRPGASSPFARSKYAACLRCRLEAFLPPGAKPITASTLPALPETVSLYLTTLAETAKVSTLTRRISAISQAHQVAGFDSPTQAPVVRQFMKGIRRTLGTAQTGKSPVKVEHLRTITAGLDPDRLLDVRDRALTAGGFRRGVPAVGVGGFGYRRSRV